MTTILVTGAAGYLGSHVVKQLLEKGINVRGTVRSLEDDARLAHLNRLAAALPGSLELVEADLLQASTFDAAVDGCSCIMHTASPFKAQVDDPDKELIQPSVRGTEAVLHSAARHKASVQRIVFTSSVAGKLYTEADWNETSSVENGQPYHLSKVVAERRAVQLAKSAGIQLISICPNFILGPPLSSRDDSLSVQFMKGILEGTSSPAGPIIEDCRDVAAAHVAAATLPLDRLQDRYIVSHSSSLSPAWISKLLSERFPRAKVQPGTEEVTPERIDNSRLKELGIQLRPPADTLVDMAAALIDLKIVQLG